MIVCGIVVAAALTCASCGNQSNLYPVAGKVTYNGAPAAGAAVFLYRRGADSLNEHIIMGLVQEDGAFELVCGSLGKGAPPGDYEVLIEWKPSSGQGRGRPERGPDKFDGRYADRKNPLFHAIIEAKANQLLPFALTD
jgi:hypothetical protein